MLPGKYLLHPNTNTVPGLESKSIRVAVPSLSLTRGVCLWVANKRKFAWLSHYQLINSWLTGHGKGQAFTVCGQYWLATSHRHSQHQGGWKHFSPEEKRAAIELRKAEVPLKKIKKELQISEASLRHVKKKPSAPVLHPKKEPEESAPSTRTYLASLRNIWRGISPSDPRRWRTWSLPYNTWCTGRSRKFARRHLLSLPER